MTLTIPFAIILYPAALGLQIWFYLKLRKGEVRRELTSERRKKIWFACYYSLCAYLALCFPFARVFQEWINPTLLIVISAIYCVSFLALSFINGRNLWKIWDSIHSYEADLHQPYALYLAPKFLDFLRTEEESKEYVNDLKIWADNTIAMVEAAGEFHSGGRILHLYAIPEEEGWDFAVLPFNTWFTPPLMPKIRYVGVIRESIAIEEFASRNDIVEVVEPLMPAPDLNASWDLEEWFAMFHERNDVVRTAVERQRAWIQKLKDDFEKSCMEK